jgi:hypothetical protein
MTENLLLEYTNLLTDLNEIVNSVSEVVLATPPAEGEWSAAFILHHIADCEIHFHDRYVRALAEDRPEIKFFFEEVYPEALSYTTRSTHTSLSSINAINNLTIEILTSMDQMGWQRISLSNTGKELTTLDLFQKALGHRKDHIEQLKSAIA